MKMVSSSTGSDFDAVTQDDTQIETGAQQDDASFQA